MTSLRAFAIAAVSTLLMVGCKHQQPASEPQKKINYNQELPPGQMALRKLSPGEYPDFSAAALAFNVKDVTTAINHSLTYLAAPSSKTFFPYLDIDHDRAVSTLVALRQILRTEAPNAAADDGKHFDAVIKTNFEIYKSIGGMDPNTNHYNEKVLFTGYCTPIYNASLTRTAQFQYPVYKRPKDLMLDSAGEHAGRKMPDGSVQPGYYTRQQIEQGHVLDGQELVWLADRFQAYVITVQGSARLKLPDGKIYEIGYAGNNGYEYKSPIRQMVTDGLIPADQVNLNTIKQYFASHPEAMEKYLPANDREIFFTERPGGPFGKLNVPVTTFATIATDKSVYPRAMPAFLTVSVPNQQNFRGLMLDQDTGGGIRASGRCDIFMGIGEQAEQLAGQELNLGELYYLAIKPELVQQFLHP